MIFNTVILVNNVIFVETDTVIHQYDDAFHASFGRRHFASATCFQYTHAALEQTQTVQGNLA